VAIDPKTGGVLAMYSNPNYQPRTTDIAQLRRRPSAWDLVRKHDSNGFQPLGLVATAQTFPPGSTFKIITTAAAVVSSRRT